MQLETLQQTCAPSYWRALRWYHILLFLCTVLLLSASYFWFHQPATEAANPGPGNYCQWYQVRFGDTLSIIGTRYNVNYFQIARANNIKNVNLIFSGNKLCIPKSSGKQVPGMNHHSQSPSGVLPGGKVSWYAYQALEKPSRAQVEQQMRQAAARYHLPTNLVLAIGWQESGWTQNVIARDGGIGAMQIMPYTAMSLNTLHRSNRDPYKLVDNINLGALYLKSLWPTFNGNLTKIVSAYNEGPWNVIHRGIFNWPYVNSVLALMKHYR